MAVESNIHVARTFVTEGLRLSGQHVLLVRFGLQQRFTECTHVNGPVDNVSFHGEIHVFMLGFLARAINFSNYRDLSLM